MNAYGKDLPLLLRVGQAAKESGLSRWTITALCNAGHIKFVFLNGNRRQKRIRLDSFLAYIESITVNSRSDMRRLTDGRRKI